ncbi:U6 snRNA-associated Sm-like protein LSm7 isoform X1 [Corvus kubaryi]|uniref:U6 snRNA-associated Sm-like protein LSm7 isoform X1 n=1 Tax=Corvus kubaryi TaxID=68294 RepID=UPI001C051FE7|nr:U6 snRNA-associated Sm-like protein LSm7 isoform X1 [Corvus kubaryi]
MASGGGGGGAGKMADKEKKKKESILDLSKYIDKTIRVKFQGGREASGVLKGFDPLLNLVLDGTIEYMRGETPPAELPPVLGNNIRQTWSCWSESRGGHGDASRAGAPLRWSQARRAGDVHLERRRLLRDVIVVFQYFKGT